jgi:hypothetical protein
VSFYICSIDVATSLKAWEKRKPEYSEYAICGEFGKEKKSLQKEFFSFLPFLMDFKNVPKFSKNGPRER